MTDRIRTTESTLKRIQDTGTGLPRLEPGQVAAALGAEATPVRLEEALSPITLLALRQELVKRLQSSGGRPGLSGVTRRAKVPLGDKEWLELEELAAAIASPGFSPSAGQVASVLLALSVRAVASAIGRASSDPHSSPLSRELAELAAAEVAKDSPENQTPEDQT